MSEYVLDEFWLVKLSNGLSEIIAVGDVNQSLVLKSTVNPFGLFITNFVVGSVKLSATKVPGSGIYIEHNHLRNKSQYLH